MGEKLILSFSLFQQPHQEFLSIMKQLFIIVTVCWRGWRAKIKTTIVIVCWRGWRESIKHHPTNVIAGLRLT